MSDEKVPGLGEPWRRLYEQRAETGLYPLLLEGLRSDERRPWHDGELEHKPVEAVDALDPFEVLRKLRQSDESVPPLDALAEPGRAKVDPDEHVCAVAEAMAARRSWFLGLVPASRGADALAVAGWQGTTNLTGNVAQIAAVVRSWEDRFGARVVAVGFDTLKLAVAAPPTTPEHARAVAVEHFAFCPDNIWQGYPDFDLYVSEAVSDREHWFFWWD
ncbi:MAG TPA: DUF4253 domain-containing protein [Spirillospora sp.]